MREEFNNELQRFLNLISVEVCGVHNGLQFRKICIPQPDQFFMNELRLVGFTELDGVIHATCQNDEYRVPVSIEYELTDTELIATMVLNHVEAQA